MSVCRYFIEPALRHFSFLAAQLFIFSMRKCDFLLLEILFSVAANKIPCYMEFQETLHELSLDAARIFN